MMKGRTVQPRMILELLARFSSTFARLNRLQSLAGLMIECPKQGLLCMVSCSMETSRPELDVNGSRYHQQ